MSRQCGLLGLPRSTHYYRPTPVRASTLRIMARIDAFYLEDPCSGSRRMVEYLAREGIPISRDRVRNLMRRMGLRAIYQKPRTTVPGEPSERFPLSGAPQAGQGSGPDLGDRSHHHPAAVRIPRPGGERGSVLQKRAQLEAHGSLDTEFCLDALEMALAAGRKPKIFHCDQGCQFTSADFVARLQAEKIKISWSGRKLYDNILVERLWRTVKY